MLKYGIITLTIKLSLIAVYADGGGELNEKCQIRNDCKPIGYLCWSNYTCQCQRPVYIPNRSKTKCVGILDQECKYDEHCIEGAFCFRQRTCQCKEDYFPSDDKTMCLNGSTRISTNTMLFLPLILMVILLGLG